MDAPAAPNGRHGRPAPSSAPPTRCGNTAKLDLTSTDDKRSSGASTSAGDVFPVHADQILSPSYPTKPMLGTDGALDQDFDYEGAVRASYYGRRVYPSFDPAYPRACPMRFIRQFEHTAQHNGLHMRAWAKRLDSCLHGRAEDWAFDESPLEMTGTSWDLRKRQFLDWALLPAEQELRRQRLLRFYQAESDLSIDFVYTFEEAAVGLRDYREDVWARKCIANLLPPIRSSLFEFWTEKLPIRFRDLRDSLYAVDWNLYEAASAPLRVVRYGAPFAYEACGHHQPPPMSSASACSSAERPPPSRPSIALTSSAPNIPQGSMYSPPAPSPSIIPTRRRRTAVGLMSGAQARALAASPPATTSNGSPAGSWGGQSHRESSEISRTGGGGGGAVMSDLVSTLSRVPERDRTMLVAALEKLASADEDAAGAASVGPAAAAAPRPAKSRGRLAAAAAPTPVSLPSPAGGKSRAATAAAVAAAAHQFASMDATTRPTLGAGTRNIEHYLLNAADTAQGSGSRGRDRGSSSRTSAADDGAAAAAAATGNRQSQTPSARGSSDSKETADDAATSTSKIKLRTRPLTSMTYDTRRRSSPLLGVHGSVAGNESDGSTPPKAHGAGGDGAGTGAQPAPVSGAAASSRRAHVRQLSSRKSDSALTTTARSTRAAGYRDDSSDADDLRSPEFTVLHPELKRRNSTRRGRFASALLRLLR
ncbi:hypothetical protein LPJ61_001863 [Coemansia biformis]|uniref:Uncharacterized protein n=1 Tax=Coemansia biformis TaxID=1286918 RepID=A0A9W8D080_9FUNG|nr:hypothetical protein LPJ61_001863 [Coemansia biformis]